MQLLEGEGVLQADPPGSGGLDEALVADEEDRLLVDAFSDDPVDLPEENRRRRETQVAAQR